MTDRPEMDPIDLEAEREGNSIAYIRSLSDHLLGNCRRSTVPQGSSESDGDNPWGDLATRELEESR